VKITALVVTYNRIEWLKKNVSAILSQTRKPDEFIIVDNASTDSTSEFLSVLSSTHDHIVVKRLNENIGGSGGFSTGLKTAVERGADWVWMMDDDALPYPDALKEVEWAISKVGNDVGVVLSKLVKSPNIIPKRKISNARIGTFVGFAVSANVVKKIGVPDAGFFIYADDYEYSLRVKKNGFRMVKIASSLIEHRDWIKQKRIFRFPFSKPSIPPWKVYYIFRNTINATRNSKLIGLAVKGYFFIDQYVWGYVNPSAKPYALRGFKDGLNGVEGKTVDPKDPKWK